jgi:hypothetical protein
MVVGEGPAAPLVKLPLAAVVGAKDQEGGGRGDPGFPREQAVDLAPHLGVLKDHDVPLLEIALGGRTQGRRRQGLDQGRIDRARQVFPMAAPGRQIGQGVVAAGGIMGRRRVAEPVGEVVVQGVVAGQRSDLSFARRARASVVEPK